MSPTAQAVSQEASTVTRTLSIHRDRLRRATGPLIAQRGSAFRRDHAESLRNARILRDALLALASELGADPLPRTVPIPAPDPDLALARELRLYAVRA